MNTGIWKKAFLEIPEVSPEEFSRLDLVSKWLIASRGAVAVMSLLSALIGGLFAYLTGTINPFYVILLALALFLAHGASDLFNDYFDYRSGLDSGNYFRTQYGPQPVISGLMTERQLLVWATVTTAFAGAMGVYFTILRGPAVLAFFILGLIILISYTGGPLPLKKFGIGEPAAFIVWGPLMIGGTFYCLTGTLPAWVMVDSVPYALGVMGVLFAKHTDKLKFDQERNIRTIPVRLGEKKARSATKIIITLMYIVLAVSVVAGYMPYLTAIAFASIPSAMEAYRILGKTRPENKPDDYPSSSWPLWFVGYTFVFNRKYGSLFVVGLIAGVILYHLAGIPPFMKII